MNCFGDPTPKKIFQKDIVEFLIENPCKTETEIQEELWGYSRKHSREPNKKYADRLRQAMVNKLITRVRVKFKGENIKRFRYYVPENVVKIIETNGNWFEQASFKDIKETIQSNRLFI